MESVEEPIAGAALTASEGAVQSPVAGEAPDERDLMTLAGGLLVAGISLVLILVIAYKTFYLHTVSTNSGIFFLGLAFFPYTGGVYMFCYAWKRGDVAAALKLTLIVAAASAAALAVFAVALTLLSRGREGGGGKPGKGGWLGGVTGDGEAVSLPGEVVLGTFGMSQRRQGPPPEVALRLTCERCGESYVPQPPKAACPACGWEALSGPEDVSGRQAS